MRIYLAAAWSRKKEIKLIADQLNEILGVIVTANWLIEDSKPKKKNVFKYCQERARIDVQDVRKADMLIRFTDDLRHKVVPARLATGARMFEMGYAYALGKKIVVVGGHQPIFDYLPGIVHVNDVETLKSFLSVEAMRG